MSYRILSAGAGAQREQERSEGIRPTVLIGLGGTGGDVLLKVRKKIYERYGRPQDFPVLQYVYMDTDTSNQHIDSSLLRDFEFSPSERFDAVVQDTAKYTRHLSQYPLIRNWWYPTTHDLGSLTVGAGQIRGYSRLGFFVNFPAVQNAISVALTAANASADVMLRRWGVAVDTDRGPNIYIVASLAGGTGSGMFLDTAFLCKTIGAGVSTVGYMILPGIFLRNQERIFGNSYAALKELEHYSYPEHSFPYEWAPGYPPRNMRPLPAPPFNYCYLVDSTNIDGKTVEFRTRHTLFEMVANSIFQDFGSSAFAARKRSVRVNLDAFLNNFYAAEIRDPRNPNETLLTEAFTTRQSAFGITSIQYPADRIKRALAAKLGADIMRRLATGKEPRGEFGKWVRETFFFNDVNLFSGSAVVDGRPVQRQDILDNLYKTDQPGRTLISAIADRVGRLQDDIRSGKHKLNDMRLSEFIRAQEQQILVNIRDETFDRDPAKWGDWCRWLRQNRENYLREEILGEMTSLGLRTPGRLEVAIGNTVNDPEKGIAFARTLLKEIRRTLTDDSYNYIPAFRREAVQLGAAIRTQQETYRAKMVEIERRENEGSIARLLFRGADLEQLTTDLINGLREYLIAIAKQRARMEAIAICESVLDKIGEEGLIDEKTGDRIGDKGLSRDLLRLEENLHNLAGDLDMLAREYSRPGEDQNALYLYDPDELDARYYPTYMGADPETRIQKVTEYARTMLESLPSATTPQERGVKVMDLPRVVEIHGQKNVVDLVFRHCQQPFGGLQNDFEVLELFTEKFKSVNDQVMQLNLLYSKAQVWIAGSNQSRFELPIQNRVLMVGMYTNPHKPGLYDGFKRLLRENIQKPHHPPMAIDDLPSRSEIIFYSEAAGYPMCYLQAAQDMRNTYESLAFDKFANLHADRNEYKFRDILEMSEEDRDHNEHATRSFLLGIMLDIIKVSKDPDSEDRLFKVQQKVGLNTNERSIGTEHRAIHVLLRDDSLRNQIDALIYQREDEIKRDMADWAKYYAVVSFYEKVNYPPKRTEKVSKEHLFQATTENLVLREKLKEIESAVGGISIDNFAANAQDLYNQLLAEASTGSRRTADGSQTADPRQFVIVPHGWAKAAAVRI